MSDKDTNLDVTEDTNVEDRGDALTPEQEAAAERDAKGRFVKKDEKTADKEGEEKDEEKADKEDEEEAEEGKETAETEEEAEEETEEEAEEEAEEEQPSKATKQVPYTRFKEVVDQRKQLQAELAALKSTSTTTEKAEDKFQAQRKAFDEKLNGLYVKVEEARADGDAKSAAALQREIDQMNAALSKAEAQVAGQQAALVVQENSAYNNMLDYLEKVRPIMDPEAPEFDKDVVAELEFQVASYVKNGMPPSKALRRACALIFVEDPFTAPVAKEKAETVPEKKTPEKKKTDVAKNVDAAKRTPPKGGGHGEGEDGGKINPANLSDEEFDKLPESIKRKMRGDEV